MLMQIIDPFG
jgi:hypothetical protein